MREYHNSSSSQLQEGDAVRGTAPALPKQQHGSGSGGGGGGSSAAAKARCAAFRVNRRRVPALLQPPSGPPGSSRTGASHAATSCTCQRSARLPRPTAARLAYLMHYCACRECYRARELRSVAPWEWQASALLILCKVLSEAASVAQQTAFSQNSSAERSLSCLYLPRQFNSKF